MLTALRRTLSYRVSVEALIELALWLAIPYLIIGVVWAFLHAEQVQNIEFALQTRVPAGANLIGFGLTAGLWPLQLITPVLCVP